jgi:hypothetical protein
MPPEAKSLLQIGSVREVLLGRSLLATLALVATVLALSGFITTISDPDKVEVVTSDVAHFWQAFDDASKLPMAERAGIYRKEYFDRASQGLKDYAAFRHVTPETLAEHVEQNRAYYSKIRLYINQVVDQKPVIQEVFRRLKALYPDIRFPAHVYFVVGPQKGAGMNSDNGIILAADMFATPPGTPYSYTKVSPVYVPFSAVHETIHFNQAYQTSDRSIVLQNVVSEGTADFIASLVLPEPAVRQSTDLWQYGCAHEAALAARLARDEDLTDAGPWMFNHKPDTGWPPDMGYWIGYRIDQAFYAQAKDKTAALRVMLGVTDFKAYLKASGYPVRREPCVPEKPVAPSN